MSWLEYTGYSEYLASDEWAAIRNRALAKHPACTCCRHFKASQVHHADYDDPALLGLRRLSLVALCDYCHERAEWDGDRKRPLPEVNAKLIQMATAAGNVGWVKAFRKRHRDDPTQWKEVSRLPAGDRPNPAKKRKPSRNRNVSDVQSDHPLAGLLTAMRKSGKMS